MSGLEQSGLEALTTPPRTLAIELAVERTFMFRGGAGAMTVSRSGAQAPLISLGQVDNRHRLTHHGLLQLYHQEDGDADTDPQQPVARGQGRRARNRGQTTESLITSR